MSYPVLYSPTEEYFDHNGIGVLSDCVACEVTEEANGIFELSMRYPVDGVHCEEIADRSIILAHADQLRGPQLFRVYAVNKTMSGIMSVYARHISYDLSYIPVKPFSSGNAQAALQNLKSKSVIDCPFFFSTDIDVERYFSLEKPASIRSAIGGVDGSILETFGGELEFNNYLVILHKNRGKDRGFSIRYGKNLTSFLQDRNCSNVITGIYPYWQGETEDGIVFVDLREGVVNAAGDFDFQRVLPVDFSLDFSVRPTEEWLRAWAQNYVEKNQIGVPSVSLNVSFEQLDRNQEYMNPNLREEIGLFDTVQVVFPALGVSTSAKVVKIVYDSLKEKVKQATIGSEQQNISDTIANLSKQKQAKTGVTRYLISIETEGNIKEVSSNAPGYIILGGQVEFEITAVGGNKKPTISVYGAKYTIEEIESTLVMTKNKITISDPVANVRIVVRVEDV